MKNTVEMKDLRVRRNARIRKDFETIIKKNYTTEYALKQLSEKYALSKITIWAIIKSYGYYADK